MASSGDPSSFTFTMDAFPEYTKFDPTKKVLAAIQIISDSADGKEVKRESTSHVQSGHYADSNGLIIDPNADTAVAIEGNILAVNEEEKYLTVPMSYDSETKVSTPDTETTYSVGDKNYKVTLIEG
jgi:hypothetical protein